MNPIPVEAMVKTRLTSDSTLVSVAVGGVYAYTELNRIGITHETMDQVYDADGYAQPLIVIKARSPLPDSGISDDFEQITAQIQFMEFWMYQWEGYDIIDNLDNHIYRLLQGYIFPGFWPCRWNYTTGPLIEEGSLRGSSLRRVDYLFRKMRKPV
jgi:hypothetical protein